MSNLLKLLGALAVVIAFAYLWSELARCRRRIGELTARKVCRGFAPEPVVVV